MLKPRQGREQNRYEHTILENEPIGLLLKISIADSGCGIKDHVLNSIF